MSKALSIMCTGQVDKLSWENSLDRPHHCAGVRYSSGETLQKARDGSRIARKGWGQLQRRFT